MHFELINEINNVNKITKNKHIAVQDVLGSHFYRKEIQAYYQGVDCNYDNAFYKNSSWRSLFLMNLGYGDNSKLHPRGNRLSFEQACSIL